MNQLQKALKKAQGDKTLGEFAQELRLSHSTLSLIYSGQRGLGRKAITALLNHPDTRAETLLFLSRNAMTNGEHEHGL